MERIIEHITTKFHELYNGNPIFIQSPGRINIIGEHTDYNDGFVFPAAIDKRIYFAVAKNNIDKFRFYANDLNESFEINVKDLKRSKTSWANYLLGIIAQFTKAGYAIPGIDCVFGGNIPLGAGMSSSAAIENGFAYAINTLFEINISKMKMVKMAQKAEHEYAGVLCGIMDQFASMHGKKNHAIKLDCRNLTYEYTPVDLQGYTIVLCDTKVKHELASSAYNTRRQECEMAVKSFQKIKPTIIALRDVSIEFLEQHKSLLDPTVYRRCEYIIMENTRVEKAIIALQEGDINTLGKLMYLSHQGLRDDFEVSCKELDILYDYAKGVDYVIGSRMMGGGFGGCTINIVKKGCIALFTKNIMNYYKKHTGIEGSTYTIEIVEGTGLI